MSRASFFVITFINVPGNVVRTPYLNMKRVLFCTPARNFPTANAPMEISENCFGEPTPRPIME